VSGSVLCYYYFKIGIAIYGRARPTLAKSKIDNFVVTAKFDRQSAIVGHKWPSGADCKYNATDTHGGPWIDDPALAD